MPDVTASRAIRDLITRVEAQPRFSLHGRVSEIVGLVVHASGLEHVAVGDMCAIAADGDHPDVVAEVVGFGDGKARLMPYGELAGVTPNAAVRPLGRAAAIGVGDALLGRVVNALGEPIDGKGPLRLGARAPLAASPPSPMARARITEPLVTGVRAIDGLLTIGRGQRMGIFAGAGVGKSVLLGMMARHTTADVNVIALLGERGREVREFIERDLGPAGLARSVVVVATGDEAAHLRARGAFAATAIAEHFRSLGRHVLLMVDSVTRVAMAWREIGLAAGEPPATKGYPPSVFARLPRLLERAGTDVQGSITGLYTVLVEGEDFNEPVADAARSVLDGHIVLSRRLAEARHYPAIEILQSTSRVRDEVVTVEHRRSADALARIEATYRDNEWAITVGEYKRGSNREIDAAIRIRPSLLTFLRQPPDDAWELEKTKTAILDLERRLASEIAGAEAAA